MDEAIDSNYYQNALRARATTDMLIGSVSQVALNHIGLLAVDEIQNVCNSKNGKSLVGMLTQLINNNGISICMVGTPESNGRCLPLVWPILLRKQVESLRLLDWYPKPKLTVLTSCSC